MFLGKQLDSVFEKTLGVIILKEIGLHMFIVDCFVSQHIT